MRPFDENQAVRPRGGSVTAGSRLSASASSRVREPGPRERMLDVLQRVHPDATVSISSQVLRQYREYRQRHHMVDAAVKPDIRRYVAHLTRRLADRRRRRAVVRDEVERGVLSAVEVVDQRSPVLSGRGGRSRGRRRRAAGRLRPRGDPRRGRHVDRRHRRRRRRSSADDRGQRRCVPEQDPDDRRRDGGRRWRVDRLDGSGGNTQGRSALGGCRARPGLLRPRRYRAHGHRRPPRSRSDPGPSARW
jgi:hypothetical protein